MMAILLLLLSALGAGYVGLAPPIFIFMDGGAEGTFAEGDPTLEQLLPDNDGDETFADAYRFSAVEGQLLAISVTSDVAVYVALQDPDGVLLSGAGQSGDQTDVRIRQMILHSGDYTVVVNSYFGHPGSYSLQLQEGTPEDLQLMSDAMPIDAMLQSEQQISDQILLSERIFRTFAIDVPAGTTVLNIDATSGFNIDLFSRYGMQILNSYNDEPDYSADGPSGDETLRITPVSDPPLREGRYFIDVVAMVPAQERSGWPPIDFQIRAALERTDIAEVLVHVQDAPSDPEDLVTGMYATTLGGDEPQLARIDPLEAPVQFWQVEVPPGARSLEIRTYEASGRLDIVAMPPGWAVPDSVVGLLGAPHRATTARDNERLIIDFRTFPPLVPGSYTIGVLDLYSQVASDYRIMASVDGALPVPPAYEIPDPEELAELSPLQRAIRATVQISLSLEEGGLEVGSGTILTPDGLILTNHHVIGHCGEGSHHLFGCVGDVYRYADSRPLDIYVAVSNEHESYAVQQFVVHTVRTMPDFDLAIVQVVSDLEGRPIEGNLPYIPMATALGNIGIGDEVSAIGFPTVAGLGSRISLTLTRGVVTGFTEDRGQRVLLNVDADIARGNSGGALVNADGVLVGVPSNTHVRQDAGERQDFARSLNLLPDEWLELLAEHGAEIH
jgi:S1-C subfamily serine protease